MPTRDTSLFSPLRVGDKLWWADQASERVGTCNKKDGTGAVVLRNSTTLVMHMKVYDESVQQGEWGTLGEYWEQGDGWGGPYWHPESPELGHPEMMPMAWASGEPGAWRCQSPGAGAKVQGLQQWGGDLWGYRPLLAPLSLLLPPSAASTNPCSVNNGDCSQLCLPTSETTRACMCTAGYSLKSGQQSCEGESPPAPAGTPLPSQLGSCAST